MHQTVFLLPAIDLLQIKPDHWYLDCTFGAGGHTREIIARGGLVCALEYDAVSFEQGLKTFAAEISDGKLILINQNFARLDQILADQAKFGPEFQFAGILYDLGTSTEQLSSPQYGLSVYQDGPLDMRLDRDLGVTAHDLLMVLSEKQLMNLFFESGGELESRKIARAIVTERSKRGQNAFQTSLQLAKFIAMIKKAPSKIHPATKVFQALRIAVNDEIGNLHQSLPQAFTHLSKQGRLAVIAFHEGEDRPVKQYFRELVENNQAIFVLKKPLVPDSQELKNPRARSAKLRVIEKI